MTANLSRRAFLATGGATALALATSPPALAAADAEVDALPYGPLGPPDANGLRLPEGFESRVLAIADRPVEGTRHPWHLFPDGGATFPLDDGGWVYVSNSEHPSAGVGGVGALRFDGDGEVVDAYPILTGTRNNCAGGPTPWGTWLSCEEHDGGRVWECTVEAKGQGKVRPALGTFNHEAVAVHHEQGALYLTEDKPDGRLYRFAPDRWPSLESGRLAVARVADDTVDWLAVPDASAKDAPTRAQVPESTPFNGGEGIWFADDVVYFTTKGDGRVWRLEPGADRLSVLYQPDGDEPVLDGVDNVTVSPAGEVFVCEDHSGEQDLVVVGADGAAGRVLRMTGQPGSELAGVALAPAGDRLYVSSQRGGPKGIGITYEIRGPFRRPKERSASTTAPGAGPATTAAEALGRARGAAGTGGDGDGGGGLGALPVVGGVGALLVAAGAATWRLRTRAGADAGGDQTR